ncbi:ABC transporter permease [Methanoculleus sp.]|uniref:ABC transporter permease n=1 Tax=Methanoculleus sp. TaxID=90427 RepID=UPI002FC8B3E8
MAFDRLLNVARKEFSDHITSRRFIIILALFLVISAVSIHDGIENYNNSLESYNEQLQHMADANIEGPYSGWMPEKPSIMYVFMSMMSYMSALGGILALAIGFDLVSKEKESRSLKTLLSHPIYRDEIINGKVLGGVGALGFAMGLALALAVAMLLIFSIVPTLDEFAAILIFGAASLGFLLAYFAIALTMSTVASESGNALIYTLVIFAIVTSLLPMFGMMAADAFAGDPPEAPNTEITRSYTSEGGYTVTSSRSVVVSSSGSNQPEIDPAWREYEEEMRAYVEKRQLISDVSNILSPQMNYYRVAMAVTNPQISMMLSSYMYGTATQEDPGGLADALGRVWMNIAALIVFPAVFFAATYVKFMRMDIR